MLFRSEIVDTIIQGMLLGGLYALFAVGLSITYGVMRVVNIAHGDFMVLAAYLGLWPVMHLDMHPFVAIVPIVILMFCLGYTVQRLVLNRTMGSNFLAPMLATFGMSIILRNGLQQIYHADSRSFQIGDLGSERGAVTSDGRKRFLRSPEFSGGDAAAEQKGRCHHGERLITNVFHIKLL